MCLNLRGFHPRCILRSPSLNRTCIGPMLRSIYRSIGLTCDRRGTRFLLTTAAVLSCMHILALSSPHFSLRETGLCTTNSWYRGAVVEAPKSVMSGWRTRKMRARPTCTCLMRVIHLVYNPALSSTPCGLRQGGDSFLICCRLREQLSSRTFRIASVTF